MKPEVFLLNEIKTLLNDNTELIIKYEYNDNIRVHFIKIDSKEDLTQIEDDIYLRFAENYPSELVAFLGDDNKYEFNYEMIFNNSLSLSDKILGSVESFKSTINKINNTEHIFLEKESYTNYKELFNYFGISEDNILVSAGNEELALAA